MVTETGSVRESLIDFGLAARPIAGEIESGDSFVIMETDDGVLVAVIDGLGHGPEAAEASRRAVEFLTENADDDLEALINGCHRHIRRTRGVVMAVAHVDGPSSTATWLGVGNVAARIHNGPADNTWETLIQRGGVVGHQLPGLRTRRVKLNPGSTLIMATDGIDSHFADAVQIVRPVQILADLLLQKHARDNDDALALVVRYRGQGRAR